MIFTVQISNISDQILSKFNSKKNNNLFVSSFNQFQFKLSLIKNTLIHFNLTFKQINIFIV